LTHIDVDVQGTDDYSGVWCDNDYIFVACGTDGLRAYSFNGSTLTHIDSDFQSGDYISVHGYGSYIFVGTWDGIRAYSFNGSTLTHLDFYQTDDLHRGIYHDGTYLFVTGDATGIEVFTFDGSNFVRLSTEHIKGDQFGIHGDGTYVFAGVYTYGLAAYGYASEMTLPSTAKDIDSYIVSVA